MKNNYRVLFPPNDASFSFMNFLESILLSKGFERKLSHQDPGSLDVYQFEDKQGHIISFIRDAQENDKDELKISSNWKEIYNIVDKAAEEFGKYVAKTIKDGKIKQ
ncbi:MAG: hypothetical protein ABH859_05355 [Pseudomonadota bacterium]